mgnify:CR=1 FL=1
MSTTARPETARNQVEVLDDQYPLVLVAGRDLTQDALLIAARDFDGSLGELLEAVLAEYPDAVTSRRPEEVLTS